MLKTYTIFLRDGREPSRFEPALCGGDSEAMARARELLVRHPECGSADVFFGQTQLFSVVREAIDRRP
ncbi:MAG: hypothetical protein JO127_03130 [Caulobacteraceae bacterium]|nr:hypothetical protein [Caulobacteraceae bacterium]